MEGWHRIPWKKIQRHGFKLHKRISQASRRGAIRTGRALPRLLRHSGSAKLLAVRRSPQANQGKKTAGVDGVTSLPPPQRLTLAQTVTLGDKAAPGRRGGIPKPGANAMRPWGIPTLHDRARHAVAHRGLEPAWEARFAPHRAGFRPGRSWHDAIEALVTSIGHTATDVLEADIAKCVARLAHAAVLKTIHTRPRLRRQGKGWLQAGG
jgi:RNA-directed DNA polymerase